MDGFAAARPAGRPLHPGPGARASTGPPRFQRSGPACRDGQKLAVTRAYQKAPLKPNGEVSAYFTPRYCKVAFCSLPG